LTWRNIGTSKQRALVEETIELWARATGLTLEEVPPDDVNGHIYHPAIEFRWGTSEDTEELRPPPGAYRFGAAQLSVQRPHWIKWVTVFINVNIPAWVGRPEEDIWKFTILHELGHAAGLGHVEYETGQIMSSQLKADVYQRGDLSGLAFISSFRKCQT